MTIFSLGKLGSPHYMERPSQNWFLVLCVSGSNFQSTVYFPVGVRRFIGHIAW